MLLLLLYTKTMFYCSRILCLGAIQRLKSLITNEAKKSLRKNPLTKTLTRTPSLPDSTHWRMALTRSQAAVTDIKC